MAFAYYQRLSPRQQAVYRRSDAIDAVALPPDAAWPSRVTGLAGALAGGDRVLTAVMAQRLLDALAQALAAPLLRVRVLEARPHTECEELHGLYQPAAGGGEAVITVWMRTARRRRLVKFRTFLRTLVHEFCHHLDYEVLGLEESFHTEGFYRRESSLVRQLLRGTGL